VLDDCPGDSSRSASRRGCHGLAIIIAVTSFVCTDHAIETSNTGHRIRSSVPTSLRLRPAVVSRCKEFANQNVDIHPLALDGIRDPTPDCHLPCQNSESFLIYGGNSYQTCLQMSCCTFLSMAHNGQTMYPTCRNVQSLFGFRCV
jgi:hypothetical protein